MDAYDAGGAVYRELPAVVYLCPPLSVIHKDASFATLSDTLFHGAEYGWDGEGAVETCPEAALFRLSAAARIDSQQSIIKK